MAATQLRRIPSVRSTRLAIILIGLVVAFAAGWMPRTPSASAQSGVNFSLTRTLTTRPPSTVVLVPMALVCGPSAAEIGFNTFAGTQTVNWTVSATSEPCRLRVSFLETGTLRSAFTVTATIDGSPLTMATPQANVQGTMESLSVSSFLLHEGLAAVAVITPVGPRPVVTVTNVINGPEAFPGTSYPMQLTCNVPFSAQTGFNGSFALRGGESRTFTTTEIPSAGLAATDAEVLCYVREVDRRGMTLSMLTSGFTGVYDENGYRSAPALRGGTIIVTNAAGSAGTRVQGGWAIAAQVSGMLPNGEFANGNSSVVALNVTVTEAASAGYVTVYDCGTIPPTSTVNFAAGDTRANLVFVAQNPYGRVCFYTSATVHLVVDIFGQFIPGPSNFNAVLSSRVLDTRIGLGGTGPGAGGRVQRLVPLRIQADQLPGFGRGEVAGAAFNVTVTEPLGPGWVAAHPCGVAPTTSNLNFVTNETVANLVVVPPDANGDVCLTASADTHLVVDAVGWFPTATANRAAGFVARPPTRVADTRSDGVGKRNWVALNLPGSPAGRMLNVTVTEPSTAGWASAVPCAGTFTVSNVNFTNEQTVANAVVADPSACIYTPNSTHVVVDDFGYFTSQIYRAIRPVRIVDTRP